MSREAEKRRAVRVSRPIEIRYAADCAPIDARIVDISENGVVIDTTHEVAVGSVIELAFSLPPTSTTPGGERVEGRGRVVWYEPRVGVGVEFAQMTPEARLSIRMFVADVFFSSPATVRA